MHIRKVLLYTSRLKPYKHTQKKIIKGRKEEKKNFFFLRYKRSHLCEISSCNCIIRIYVVCYLCKMKQRVKTFFKGYKQCQILKFDFPFLGNRNKKQFSHSLIAPTWTSKLLCRIYMNLLFCALIFHTAGRFTIIKSIIIRDNIIVCERLLLIRFSFMIFLNIITG